MKMTPATPLLHVAEDVAFSGLQSRRVRLVTDSLETPSLDDRSYRVIQLENELEVLLVHDAKADKASASMDVNVGNFSDDPDIPGMAHAVEHVCLFDDGPRPQKFLCSPLEAAF